MSIKGSLYSRLANCIRAVRTNTLVMLDPPFYPDISHHIATNILGAVTIKQAESLIEGLEAAIEKTKETKKLIAEKENKL